MTKRIEETNKRLMNIRQVYLKKRDEHYKSEEKLPKKQIEKTHL